MKKNQIIDLETKKAYDIPAEFNSPELTAEMDDLNLIFLIKNNAILSFSATAKKFQTNNVIMEENAGISAAASYLTYLYLVDGKNNQIYRYPRAEGGFGLVNCFLEYFPAFLRQGLVTAEFFLGIYV